MAARWDATACASKLFKACSWPSRRALLTLRSSAEGASSAAVAVGAAGVGGGGGGGGCGGAPPATCEVLRLSLLLDLLLRRDGREGRSAVATSGCCSRYMPPSTSSSFSQQKEQQPLFCAVFASAAPCVIQPHLQVKRCGAIGATIRLSMERINTVGTDVPW